MDRLKSMCGHADAFLGTIALRGDPVGHHTTRLLKLLERYGARELDAALAEALARVAVSVESAAHIVISVPVPAISHLRCSSSTPIRTSRSYV